MSITMTVRDTRMFGPNVELTRTIRCILGENVIHIDDHVINRADEPCSHAMLYHVNLGYPLLDEGSRLILGGRLTQRLGLAQTLTTNAQLKAWKTAPPPLREHRGFGESILVVEPDPHDDDPQRRIGLINAERGIGLGIDYRRDQLPHLGGMLHCGPRGSYMAALEPFYGSILGKDRDDHPDATGRLEPGESRMYNLRIHAGVEADFLRDLAGCDQPLHL
jgi:hypothetical protein